MVNYREILRLNNLKYTQRQIAASVHSSHNTVSDVVKLASEVRLDWPLDDSHTNEVLYGLLYPKRLEAINPRMEPVYSCIHKELARPGVNLTLPWTEYCTECHTNGLTPYMYSQFCDKYRHWAHLTKATMRINHKPGDVMQVDWAGTTIKYQDSVTGEACDDMKTTNWLLCHVYAYNYFGGVTRLIIPDNLKTGVVKNTRYDTVLNRSYEELAEYYNTAVVPARVRHPKVKSLAEGTVKFSTTWVIAALRNRRFFSIDEVKQAVAEKLEELNHSPFKKREGCRYSAYSDEEQAFMKPLPLTPFEPAAWVQDIGFYTAKIVEYFLTIDHEPEQGYKSCASLTKLNDKYGCNRLEDACEKVLSYISQPTIRIISTTLKNGQDKVKSDTPLIESKSTGHGITRGAAYFRKGGAVL